MPKWKSFVKIMYKYYQGKYLKAQSRKKVFVYLRNKKISKNPCFCGETIVEAHHEDYLKPLNIQWLCKKHHKEADKKLRLLAMI